MKELNVPTVQMELQTKTDQKHDSHTFEVSSDKLRVLLYGIL